jgi:ribosomal protein S27E
MEGIMNDSQNPLAGYFRQPAIYVRLPSDGKYYPDGTIEISENNEYPILPMTAMDEISYRTPDALYNGQAVVSVIESCVPNIKNAWAIPACDIDTLLIGIRIATYGHDLDLNVKCPKCENAEDRTLDLRQALDQLEPPQYEEPIVKGDLAIYLHPMTYKNLNENNAIQFEEQKIIQMLPDTEIDEEDKIARMNQALSKITEMTVRALAQNITIIKTPDATVSEPAYIEDFLNNTDRDFFNLIRNTITERKRKSELKPVSIECSECNNVYEQGYTMDMTNFSGAAS